MIEDSPNVRESKTVLDSGFHAVDSGLTVLDFSLCQWNMDFGFQSLVGFRIPWAVFWIPKSRTDFVFPNKKFSEFADLLSKNFQDSGIRARG